MISACSTDHERLIQTGNYPPISPDYINVTVPYNIAPLNFKITDTCDRVEVTFKGRNSMISTAGKYKIGIPLRKWNKLLEEQKNDSVSVNVFVLKDGKWHTYRPFVFYVSGDRIDPYLSYRLIEPGYEVWNKLQIAQRNIENFKERIIVDNNLLDGGCVNCHIYSKQDPSVSFFHLRHKEGGTMVQKNGIFRKLNTAADSTISAGIYGNWHPGGRFIAFSTNVIIPEFHSINNLRLEVYDTISDIIIADIEKNEILKPPLLSLRSSFETFPVFSADGRKLYFCSAKETEMPANFKSVKYSLCSIDFNPDKISFGSSVDTLVSSRITGKTVTHPKPSPDGRYILYTSFDYGNFPVWHREADLYLLRLSDMSVDSLPAVNSAHADSYHSWSSYSRWFVFASKRDNGMYGKLYFTHVSEEGICGKPFLLPQKDPDFYDFYLKSYNIPEMADGPVPYSPEDVEKAFRKLVAEPMKFISW